MPKSLTPETLETLVRSVENVARASGHALQWGVAQVEDGRSLRTGHCVRCPATVIVIYYAATTVPAHLSGDLLHVPCAHHPVPGESSR